MASDRCQVHHGRGVYEALPRTWRSLWRRRTALVGFDCRDCDATISTRGPDHA